MNTESYNHPIQLEEPKMPLITAKNLLLDLITYIIKYWNTYHYVLWNYCNFFEAIVDYTRFALVSIMLLSYPFQNQVKIILILQITDL